MLVLPKEVLSVVLLMATAIAGPVSIDELGPVNDDGEKHSSTSFRFDHEGDAGDWMLVYQELPEPTQSVDLDVDVEVLAKGDNEEAVGLFAGPALLLDLAGGVPRWMHENEDRGPLFVDREGHGEEYVRDETWSAQTSGFPFIGLLFVVASNVPWTAQGEIQVLDGDQGNIDAAVVITGDGVSVVPDGLQSQSPLETGPLMGTIRLDATLHQRGWTHLQHDYDAMQPVAERELEITFPDGVTISSSSSMTGVNVPMGPGAVSASNWRDYTGLQSEVAGDLSSKLEYTHAALRVQGAMIHLPMGPEDLPERLVPVHYGGSNTLAQDPWLPL